VKSVPVLRVSTTPGAGRLAATVRVTARGVSPVPGVVRIRSGGRVLSQLTLHDGVASTTLRGLRAGTRVFRFRYLYSAQVYRGAVNRTITIG
jgi:hypothetical protein